MASYDSDESMSDDETGTSTNVLLGYASKEPTEDPTSHLGGVPTWLDPEQPPSFAYARCLSCSQPMSLLLELNGDLPERFPGHERRLYIWGCRKKQCRRKPGSIRALRNVRVTAEAAQPPDANTALKNGSNAEAPVKQQAPQEPKPNLGAQLFGGGSSSSPFTAPPSGNPFSSGPAADSTKSNPFSPSSEPKPQDLATTFAQKARITDPTQDKLPHPPPASAPAPAPTFEPWPTPADPTPHPHYHLDADYEYLTREPAAGPSAAHAALLDADTGGPSEADNTAPLPDDQLDRAFQAFADALAQNPEQVLRYEFGGAPLLCARDDGVARALRGPGMPACAACGGPRALELQLVPGAIAALEAELEVARVLAEGMEWGTVLVGVCAADCAGPASGVYAREEWVGVQWEEVVARGGAGVDKGTGKGKDKGKGKG